MINDQPASALVGGGVTRLSEENRDYGYSSTIELYSYIHAESVGGENGKSSTSFAINVCPAAAAIIMDNLITGLMMGWRVYGRCCLFPRLCGIEEESSGAIKGA